MTDGTPGWFRDPNDDSLARWHDGKSWTEHTLVIADQAPGVEPAPPQIDPEPEPTADVDADDEPAFVLPRRSTIGAGRGLPGWFKVAGPLAVVALLVVAFTTLSGDDDDPSDQASTADTVAASLDDAIRAARRAGLTDAVSDPRAGALIERICGAARRPTAVDQLGEDLGELPASSPSQLRQQVGALGVGAAERCPADLEDAPDLVDDLQDLAVDASATTTTAPDLAAGDGTADAGSIDGGTDDGSGSGTGSGSGSGSRTSTTRRSAGGGGGGTTGGTGTTAAPATTTTLPGVLKGSACSTSGAQARDKVSGGTLTCQPRCGVSNKLQWRSGPCPTNPAPPTPDPNQPTPTTAAPTTTAPGSDL